MGGAFVKIVPVIKGFTDRLLILPGYDHAGRFYARYAFVEMKRRRGGKVSAVQAHVHETLRRMGCEVAVVRNREDFYVIVDSLRG